MARDKKGADDEDEVMNEEEDGVNGEEGAKES